WTIHELEGRYEAMPTWLVRRCIGLRGIRAIRNARAEHRLGGSLAELYPAVPRSAIRRSLRGFAQRRVDQGTLPWVERAQDAVRRGRSSHRRISVSILGLVEREPFVLRHRSVHSVV